MARNNLASTETAILQCLVFSLSGEVYAISLLGVKEIIEFGGVTAIPTMPSFIRGVINLRGRVVPVMDLSARFGEGRTEIGERTCIVILEQEGSEQDMGVVVDSVNAVVDVNPTDIEPAPSFGARVRVDFIQGMWKYQDQFVVVLDLAKVLSVEEITQIVSLAQEQDAA
jgi:purine-binding chemotaxis protein CheW